MIKVGIIGLGKIGFQYSFNCTHDFLLTHCDVIDSSNQLRIAFGIDKDFITRKAFEERFQVRAYLTHELGEIDQKVDLVIISTPTDMHAETLKFALSLKPKLVLLEKPVEINYKKALECLRLQELYDVPVIVNYQRNYHPEVQGIKLDLQKLPLNTVSQFIGNFTGEWTNSGSHLVSLVQAIWQTDYLEKSWLDKEGKCLKLQSGSREAFIIQAPESRNFLFSFSISFGESFYEFDSTFDELVFSRFGQNDIFPQENTKIVEKVIKMNDVETLKYVYENILNYFNGDEFYATTLKSAVETMRIIGKFQNGTQL